MKVKLKVEKEYDVQFLIADLGVRYWEDSEVNGVEDSEGTLIPLRVDDRWIIKIDLDSGQIQNWPKGTTAEIHYKVCDDGKYTILDSEGNLVAEIEDYVPSILCPKEEGYGDYVIMDIDESGFIQDFDKSDIKEIFNNED